MLLRDAPNLNHYAACTNFYNAQICLHFFLMFVYRRQTKQLSVLEDSSNSMNLHIFHRIHYLPNYLTFYISILVKTSLTASLSRIQYQLSQVAQGKEKIKLHNIPRGTKSSHCNSCYVIYDFLNSLREHPYAQKFYVFAFSF
jgi:hypothetical protein